MAALIKAQVQVALAALKQLSTPHDRNNLALAAALWHSGWYEARMLASFVNQPARLTPVQMDRWAKDFDNWGICDTVCFVLLIERAAHDERHLVKKAVNMALRAVGKRSLALNAVAVTVVRRLAGSPNPQITSTRSSTCRRSLRSCGSTARPKRQ